MIIFSLYVLTLSAIPCCGDDYCCEDEQAFVGEGKHSDHDNHNKPELPCSPFFSCNTCHGAVVPEIDRAAFNEVSAPRSIYADYIEKSLPEFSAAIWQPPQLF
ncbi:DUF6660 family protein [Chitinophaga sp. CC14]|uniref:DUF6660 family protein n=1 Tax=Chitinophaga sp. CC14 TaxID=3029199 RepID=UPI003B97EF23